jgi:FHA domain-containing protein
MTASRSTSSSHSTELQEALLRGFNLPGSNIGPLTPELMELCGQLLREAVHGTVELLRGRALTKREVRAQITTIVPKENNPLKFSPNVEVALSHLLAPRSAAFMESADAMRDAYNDLRSHEVGVMTGMRAALHGLLARFDPVQLEQRLTRDTVLSSLLPSTRKAKLWDLYEVLYRQILREAEDDFQSLFGKEFLKAYEAQIDALEKQDPEDRR